MRRTRVHRGAGRVGFGLALALMLATSPAAAEQTLRYGFGTGTVPSALEVSLTLGLHPSIGWYKEEGITVEPYNFSGALASMQALAAGQVDFANVVPTGLAELKARHPAAEVVCVYNWTPKIHWEIAVLPGSPVQKFEDLKGQQIGVNTMGDSVVQGVQAAAKHLGWKPAELQLVVVGFDVSAANALMSKRVAAWATYDSPLAVVAGLGHQLRTLPHPADWSLPGTCIATNRAMLQQRPDTVRRVLRVVTKSLVFAMQNPRVATELHAELYPAVLFKDRSYEESIHAREMQLRARLERQVPLPGMRWGEFDIRTMRNAVAVQGVADRVSAETLFTNEYLDLANAVDLAAVRVLADRAQPSARR
jgi:ABC-type nitrate/sulfonate/bicarbonate transport system substrate-binding protein